MSIQTKVEYTKNKSIREIIITERQTKNLIWEFTQIMHVQMVNKHLKRCSSPVTREKQIKTTKKELPWWCSGDRFTFLSRRCGVHPWSGELGSHMTNCQNTKT